MDVQSMENGFAPNADKMATVSEQGEGVRDLQRVSTTITLSPEQFERLYLNPLKRGEHSLMKKLANPTPLALASFVVTTTPFSIALMGWGGAGGNGIALTGAIVFLGGTMLAISGLLEFILGNTFSFVVFSSFGAFWLAFGFTLAPALNVGGTLTTRAIGKTRPPCLPSMLTDGIKAPYSASGTDNLQGLSSEGFVNTYAFFLLSMDILVVIYGICALTTNVVFLAVFGSLVMVFSLLSAAYWRLGVGDTVVGNRLIVGGGASLFVTSILGWYLLMVQLFDTVNLPIKLPVGDLSRFWEKRRRD
ncbi:hypothetical protein CLAIMM_15160 [Cladophialophora immunda]|nr:hypothetical protein CLAIMM_15160 [Cladophialophora immunda]